MCMPKRFCARSSRRRRRCSVRVWPSARSNGWLKNPSMDERRTLRVSEALREELSEIIGFETEDPRLLAVEVVEAHVSPDGRHATVRVVIRGTDKEQKESL